SDPRVFSKAFLSVSSDGKLWLNFGCLQGETTVEGFRDGLAEGVRDSLGISIPGDYARRYPSVDIKNWGPRVDAFIKLLRELSAQYPRRNS
ncbi:MAG: hypothetical protein ACMUIL_07900, partial [bacterium]